MKHAKPSGMNRPFEDLNRLIRQNALPLADDRMASHPPKPAPPDRPPDAEEDRRLFKEAMADVTPIDRRGIPGDGLQPARSMPATSDPEDTSLTQLQNLVAHGRGFVVADTPEYIEGTGYCISPEVTRRLHRGDFSIQAHIDLHGMTVSEAQEAFETFIGDALARARQGVLIVHGRGLSSPAEPVLKTKVYEWLTRGRWRKWVIAFTSARSCDGGAGATYVLLRWRPLTKRFRKSAKKQRRL